MNVIFSEFRVLVCCYGNGMLMLSLWEVSGNVSSLITFRLLMREVLLKFEFRRQIFAEIA